MLKEKFSQQEWFHQLSGRRETFSQMVEYVEKSLPLGLDQIIETGTARSKGNWSGDGQSTLIWDWLTSHLKGLKVISIDSNVEAIEMAKSQTKNVDFHLGDSVKCLKAIDPKILSRVSLLYLDSMDWSYEANEESAKHHLKELQSVWERLSAGCMIVVDDVHGAEYGKHVAVAEFMKKKRIKTHFSDYQIAWIKA